VWDEDDSAGDDDNLAGLELAEDHDTGDAMDLDGDDMLAQMEARLARLSSRVSHIFLKMHIDPLAHLVENGFWYCA